MKTIFLDANMLIDYLNIESGDHLVAKDCLKIIRTYFHQPVISPYTVLITNYLTGKFRKDKAKHRQEMALVFSGFEVTSIISSDIAAVFINRVLI